MTQSKNSVSLIDPSRNVQNEHDQGQNVQIEHIEARLKPIKREELADLLELLNAGWPNKGERTPAEAVRQTQAMAVALAVFSRRAVEAAVTAALQGRIGREPGWMPVPAEIATYCRAFETLDREELIHLRRKDLQIAGRGEPSEEHKKRMVEKFEVVKKALAERSIEGDAVDLARRASREKI
jgi:hypothetical protein